MPKQCPSGLTKTSTKGYSRTIGYYRSDDGRRVPRKFWLGHDRSAALRKLKALPCRARPLCRASPSPPLSK
jgi:hypothetical protein